MSYWGPILAIVFLPSLLSLLFLILLKKGSYIALVANGLLWAFNTWVFIKVLADSTGTGRGLGKVLEEAYFLIYVWLFITTIFAITIYMYNKKNSPNPPVS